jgi:hypothetical protein
MMGSQHARPPTNSMRWRHNSSRERALLVRAHNLRQNLVSCASPPRAVRSAGSCGTAFPAHTRGQPPCVASRPADRPTLRPQRASGRDAATLPAETIGYGGSLAVSPPRVVPALRRRLSPRGMARSAGSSPAPPHPRCSRPSAARAPCATRPPVRLGESGCRASSCACGRSRC